MCYNGNDEIHLSKMLVIPDLKNGSPFYDVKRLLNLGLTNCVFLGAVHKGYPTFQLVSRVAKMGYEDI